MASGMAWNGNNQQIGFELNRVNAGQLNFNILGGAVDFIFVENAIAAKMLMKFLMVGYIISMR